MSPVAYEDSVRVAARLLTAEIDSVLAYLPTCQREAGHRGVAVANTIVGMLQGYDGALQRYRVAIAPPSSGPEQP